jgi:glycosyltransferase involved in cell wall biosynthesis
LSRSGACGNVPEMSDPALTGTVSVVIPTRDRRELVLEAARSVLAQRGCEVELIVVDDGSRDGTDAALHVLGDRLRYVRQEARGVSAARNRGAGLARGPWLAFLDSDDLWRPDKLARQLELHRRRPPLAVSQTGEIWIRNGRRVNPCLHHAKPQGDIFLPSLQRCLVSPSAVLMRRDLFLALGGFDETLEVCEDYDLWLRLAGRYEVGLVPEPLVVRRGGHPDQLSRRHWGMDRFRVAALLKLLSCAAVDDERRSAVAETLRRKCGILAHGARRRGRHDEADRYLSLCGAWTDV